MSANPRSLPPFEQGCANVRRGAAWKRDSIDDNKWLTEREKKVIARAQAAPILELLDFINIAGSMFWRNFDGVSLWSPVHTSCSMTTLRLVSVQIALTAPCDILYLHK
jgi:hypothetical protein